MRLAITSLGQGGDGIAEHEGARWYVPYTAPGDLIEAVPVKDANRARLQHLHAPGPDRIEAPCPHFGRCGGCALQHLDDAFLSQWKRDNLEAALKRRGFDKVVIKTALTGAPGRRRRVTFTAKRNRQGRLTLGFHERRAKGLVPIEQCPVLEPALAALIDPLKQLTARLLTGAEARLHLNLTDGGIDLLLDGRFDDGLAAHETLTTFAETHDIARISLADGAQPRTITERRRPELRWDRLTVVPPPGAFLQADRAGEAAMRALVKGWAEGARSSVDLFAGAGTLASALPLTAGSLAVDADEAAILALKAAINRAPGADLKVTTRNLYRRPLMPAELKRFDLAVLDPPAAGAKDQCQMIAESALKRVIYVSCAPGTFARDARTLADAGFRIAELHLIDQFHWSPDIELAALLVRP